MNPIVERVARALCGSCYGEPNTWRDYEKHARVAIAAMREPTEVMAGWGGASRCSSESSIVDEAAAIAIWHAMIRAALKD